MIDLEFPHPKDPQDDGLYFMRAPEPVASVIGVTAVESVPQDLTGVGLYSTAGDAVASAALVPSSWDVNTSDVTTSDGKVIPAGLAIMFRLSGGTPQTSYAVRAGFITVSGSTLYRSAILVVTGL